jgi:hypothetical protein
VRHALVIDAGSIGSWLGAVLAEDALFEALDS